MRRDGHRKAADVVARQIQHFKSLLLAAPPQIQHEAQGDVHYAAANADQKQRQHRRVDLLSGKGRDDGRRKGDADADLRQDSEVLLLKNTDLLE